MNTTARRVSHETHAAAIGSRASASSKAMHPTDAFTNSPTIALVLDHRSASLVAARRAVHMADALEARVDVLLAIPEGTASAHPALFVSQVSHIVEALRPRHGFHLDVFHGTVDDAARSVGKRAPLLLVVDPSIGARTVTSLVEDLEIPVLVARDARDGEIIAATDMRSPEFPVCSLARTYADALGRKIAYLHNARPMPVLTSDPMAGPSTYVGMLELQDDVAAAKGARLRAFADDPTSAHLSRTGSTVDAILELARFHDADLVVVGHRARPWWVRVLRTGVARSVVDQSFRSVLVTPLGDDA